MHIMERAGGRNQTLIMEFILLGFGNPPELQPFLFLLFLVIYGLTMAGNILIVAVIVVDQHLHFPMYYLLGNLSWLETCYTSTLLPRLLASLLTGKRTISVKGCMVQMYFFGIMSTAESLLLMAMSYDRYLAICNPLRYTSMMNGRVCCQLVAGSWLSSMTTCSIGMILLLQMTFCDSKEIDHFFCDFSLMLQLACDETQTLELVIFAIATMWTFVPCLLTLTSYVCIISTILRIPSTTGRKKAFSTCSSHLIMLAIFYLTIITVYIVPTGITTKVLNKIFSVFYTVLTPLLNPIVYSLRSKEVNESLRKAFHKLSAFWNSHTILKHTF
ncbi:olfactory receptor 1E16-like [Carettochelys insculpta]|uniref:olfactory receptor 1E16-like n=1 Tax=Carettochelys insculpta TaxID=44489 RepID=UPI003EBFCA00